MSARLLPLLAAALASQAFAADPPSYQDDILPVFRDHCNGCHNPDKLKADLDLTSYASTIKGGSSGPAVPQEVHFRGRIRPARKDHAGQAGQGRIRQVRAGAWAAVRATAAVSSAAPSARTAALPRVTTPPQPPASAIQGGGAVGVRRSSPRIAACMVQGSLSSS